jgi:hypothetical protein
MRERIGRWLYPALPILVVAGLWLYAEAKRLDEAERRVYEDSLPRLIRRAVADLERDTGRVDGPSTAVTDSTAAEGPARHESAHARYTAPGAEFSGGPLDWDQ